MTDENYQACSDAITLACPAKVNLALGVASPQPDGMHPIASLMAAVTFADTLTLTRLDQGGSSRFALAWAADAPVPGCIDWPLEKDLMFRAHQLLEAHLGNALRVTARLVKRIPTGAGLGGGSSDAAAMLVGLNQLFDLSLDDDVLGRLAIRLGSDVPFLVRAMRGHPVAIVQGLGERLEPVSIARPAELLLIFPQVACPTGPVYKAYDQLIDGQQRTNRLEEVEQLATDLQNPQAVFPVDKLFNDLAAAACLVQPKLGEIQQAAARLLGQPVHVTGSGSTLYVIVDDSSQAQAMAAQVSQALALPCLATRTGSA